jgi:hypothetical protein
MSFRLECVQMSHHGIDFWTQEPKARANTGIHSVSFCSAPEFLRLNLALTSKENSHGCACMDSIGYWGMLNTVARPIGEAGHAGRVYFYIKKGVAKDSDRRLLSFGHCRYNPSDYAQGKRD